MDERPQYWDPMPVVGSSSGVLVTDPQSEKQFELPPPVLHSQITVTVSSRDQIVTV
jgi:hypothetical protein